MCGPRVAAAGATETEQHQLCSYGRTFVSFKSLPAVFLWEDLRLFQVFTQTCFSARTFLSFRFKIQLYPHVAFSILFPGIWFLKYFTCLLCNLCMGKDLYPFCSLLYNFHFRALEKEMATHSSVLAWRIPGTGEPGGLPSVGLHRVGHD